ncbi:hypothetical protein QFC24_003504 [Naganishia onofrii]|uniref:Uncharacterized protein n=1 Tax=Naganishia onofrii TaxID=1851511 RepID=A0ACC2XI79_9TREE|nr:hypothetical protein QFC24_003504 [Naganishia onofrii]
MQARVYDPLELNHISTLYCDHIYLGSTGKDNAANVVLAEAMRLAITLALHDENVAEQQGLDAIERDCRRRVFWVLYGSDRTIAALISCPMLLSDDDIDVGDILECDDSLITAAGAFPQPAGKTPILSGFIHVTRIFRLLSRVLRYVRAKAKSNAREDGDDGMTTDRGNERFPDPRVLIESLQALLDDLPVPLRLQSHNTEHRSKAEAQAFDTCKANILVSQVLVRFAIYQYAMLHSAGQAETCLTELTDDVLRRLHEMSSESLAANGESIRHKVLFIASSLLNKYPGNNAGADHVAEFLAVVRHAATSFEVLVVLIFRAVIQYNKILTNQNKLGMDVEIAEDGEPAGDEGQ